MIGKITQQREPHKSRKSGFKNNSFKMLKMENFRTHWSKACNEKMRKMC
jgi:hypothetical protein